MAPTKSPFVLCLSGGGFRAALFHLGVIEALRKTDRLSSIKYVCSVSGGSIIAAHLILNWPAYSGKSEEDFKKVRNEFIKCILNNDIRSRAVRRKPLAPILRHVLRKPEFNDSIFLSRELDRVFFKNARLGDLKKEGAPDLRILATDATCGESCEFSWRGTRIYTGAVLDGWEDQKQEPILVPCDDLKLSLAVTASCAVPGIFPPVVVSAERKEFESFKEKLPWRHRLYDGGVFDNLGVRRAEELVLKERDLGVIASDASGAFDSQSKDYLLPLIPTLRRTIDMLMRRIRQTEVERLRTRRSSILNINNPTYGITLQDAISEETTSNALPLCSLSASIQSDIKYIRTDLDNFNATEVNCLVEFGYCKALVALLGDQSNAATNANVEALRFVPPIQETISPINRANIIRDGRRLNFWKVFIGLDRIFIPYLGVFLFLFLPTWVFLIDAAIPKYYGRPAWYQRPKNQLLAIMKSSDAIRTLRKSVTVDLSQYFVEQPQGSDAAPDLRYAHISTRYELVKQKGVDVWANQYETTSRRMALRCITHEASLNEGPLTLRGNSRLKQWNLRVDVASEPVGVPFEVIDVWESFGAYTQCGAQSSHMVKVGDNPCPVSLEIRFAVDKGIPSDLEAYEYTAGSSTWDRKVPEFLTRDEVSNIVRLTVESPSPNKVYQIAWCWDK